ncbi:MAG: hypothetical protein AAFU61_05470 [Pseudomonadota bacterium]
MRLSALLLAAAMAVAAAPALAVTATFDFTGGPNGPAFTVLSNEADAASVDVTASAFVRSAAGVNSVEVRDVARSDNGWGVVGNPDANRMGSDDTRDPQAATGSRVREALTFSFSSDVTSITGIVFEHEDGGELFEILDGDGARIGDTIRVAGGGAASTVQTFAALSIAPPDSTITIRHRNTGGSGIRIQQLTVQLIPAPAGLLAIASAFAVAGGLGAARRRRRA